MASKRTIQTDKAPEAIGPYSQAVVVGDTVYCSGQVPLVPETMELVSGDIEAQTHQVMENLRAVLSEAGSDFSRVVKFTIFLDRMSDFKTVNQLYSSYLSGELPARETVAVAELPKGAKIEISCIALKGD